MVAHSTHDASKPLPAGLPTLLVSWGEGRVTPWTRRHFIAGPGTYTYTYTYTHLELLNSGRRPEYLEGTCTDTGRTCYPRRSSVWWCSWREDSRKTKSTCVDGAFSFRAKFPSGIRCFRFGKTQEKADDFGP